MLGDGTITNRSSPVAVIGNHNFVQYDCGEYQTIALKEDGTAWAWGNNLGGALGDDTNTNRSSPVQVVGNHIFKKVAAGGGSNGNSASYGLKDDGSLWAWGYNGSGRLGTNNLTDYSSPVQVVGNHSFMEIYAENDFSIALKSNGEIWSWGNNIEGKLADGTILDRSSPVMAIGSHNFLVERYGLHGINIINTTGTYMIKPVVWINIAGTWKRVCNGYVNVNGTWRPWLD